MRRAFACVRSRGLHPFRRHPLLRLQRPRLLPLRLNLSQLYLLQLPLLLLRPPRRLHILRLVVHPPRSPPTMTRVPRGQTRGHQCIRRRRTRPRFTAIMHRTPTRIRRTTFGSWGTHRMHRLYVHP